jgi:protein SCO1/2
MNFIIKHRLNLIASLIILFGLVAGLFFPVSASEKTENSLENPCYGSNSQSDAKSNVKSSTKNNAKNFTLTSHLGSKVSLSDYKGKIVILLFGYTHCPDVCPTQLNDMQRLLKSLGDKADQVQVLFITFDPARDTAKALKKYLAFFNPTFVGLTGTDKEIAAVAKQYKAQFIKRELGSKTRYMIAHSSAVYLLDKQGQLRSVYFQNLEDANVTLPRMASDIEQLLKKDS